ncbi:LOW QUALITY PROTEIN: UBN2 domain-containing protein, partial [Cephalotus follicularis]
LIFLRHHIDDGLKYEYLTVENSLELWQNLNDRFEHLKAVVLPKALNDWAQLFQDFKTVSEYNSTLFKIVSQLKMCGEVITEDMLLEKTYRTFHASNVLLQQQYRLHGFKKYRELIGSLLIAEQNNELLLQNHVSRPTGSASLPEVNATSSHFRGRGGGRGRRGNGRNQNFLGPRNNNSMKWQNPDTKQRQKWRNPGQSSNAQSKRGNCHRCGMEGHWHRACRTAKHCVDLYQASLNEKGKQI